MSKDRNKKVKTEKFKGLKISSRQSYVRVIPHSKSNGLTYFMSCILWIAFAFEKK